MSHGGTRGGDIKDFIARETSVSQQSPPPCSPPASPLPFVLQVPVAFALPGSTEGRKRGGVVVVDMEP